MATPPQLVQTVSQATGLALATVVDMDRRLVKAQLRSKGGRGLNAAQVTVLDAARLLTAVLASPHSNVAADAVLRYQRTQAERDQSNAAPYGKIALDGLAALPPGHNFVEGLAALIVSGASGSLAKLISGTKGAFAPHLEVFALTGATRGRIGIFGLPRGLTATVEYLPIARKRKTEKLINSGSENSGDLQQSRRISEQTILSIARLFVT